MKDFEKDIEIAKTVIGKDNEFFKPIWNEFASGWDGQPCSEIACCISYMAGNIGKIYVSNYAEGLANLYDAYGQLSDEPKLGDFVFFGYGGYVPQHTGRLIAMDNAWLTVVEGNIDGMVVCRDYMRTSKDICSFGHPKYDAFDCVITPDEFIANAIQDVSLWEDVNFPNMITMVQAMLKDAGYYFGSVDGIYGSFTTSAVKRYQAEHGLFVDGWIGINTWRKMLNGN